MICFPIRPTRALLSLGSLAVLAAPAICQDEAPVEVAGPGEAAKDVFHPDRDKDAEVLYGGRVIVHLASLPENICYPIENSAITRRLLR